MTGKGERRLPRTIAIDGPSASGKSSVGYLVAERLGYLFLDTGATYRALTWLALQRGVHLEDEEGLVRLAAQVDMNLGPPAAGSSERCTIWVDGDDLTGVLRQPDVERGVSLVSRVSQVRRAMVAVQRRLASRRRVVMAGRDVGTVVLPNADLKIYLDASVEERARRRHEELAALGRPFTQNDVRQQILRRDAIDSGREDSPLKAAEDAIVVSTDGLNQEQVVEKIVALMEGKS
ncbi:MAG: (d)CMP kinase [Dehalococcoidia bacterium]|nr:MAG: (d)CMP kinase [Dehalococcoidia bacterium]